MATRHDEAFGDLLRHYRLAGGLTQEELAARAGLSVRGLIYLEQNARRPYRDTVRRLAAALALDEAARIAFEGAASLGQAAETLPPLGTLPQAPGPLIGRDEDLSAVTRLLHDAQTRLVTVVGPPGVGKTHLSIEAAHASRDAFADGAAFVALAPIADPALVLVTIARALGVSEQPGRPMRETLHATLRERELLLVLDNCEHLLDAASEVAALLAACAGLCVLATSRAALRLRAERPYPLAPLPLPDLARLPAVDELSRNPAVALFTRRAQAVKADFALTADNVAAVAEVCARLDGLPLALELAAARVKMLAPQALLARLDQRLPLLAGGARDLPERQQTLRAAITWSYDLLAAPEQTLFRRLSIFVGGATLEAILAVCEAEIAGTENGVIAGLEGLVDHNLLRAEVQAEGDAEPRFGMLETLREYGLEQLVVSGEEEQIRARHAAYYLALAERAEPEARGPQQAAWFERLEREHDNLRVALGWARERDDTSMLLRMVLALGWFWIMHGHIDEWHHWIDALLQIDVWPVSPDVHIHTLNFLGQVTRESGDYARAWALHEQELNLCRQSNDVRGIADALYCLGSLAQRRNEYTMAVQLQQESVATARLAGDPWLLATTLSFLAYTLVFQGRYEQVRILAEEALALRWHEQEQRGIAQSLWELGLIAHHQGDGDEATARYGESVAILRQLGDLFALGYVLCDQADLLRRGGDCAPVRALLEESLSYRRQMRDVWGQAISLRTLGLVAQQEAKFAEASAFYRESLAIFQRLNDRWGTASTLEGIASLASLHNRPAAALQLYAKAAKLREAIGTPLPPIDRPDHEAMLAKLRAVVGEQAYAEAWVAGQATPLEQVIASAMAIVRDIAEPVPIEC